MSSTKIKTEYQKHKANDKLLLMKVANRYKITKICFSIKIKKGPIMLELFTKKLNNLSKNGGNYL